MKLVELASLGDAAREQLAVLTLASAQSHAPEWLTDLDEARQEIADALDPEKLARVLLDDAGVAVGWIAAEHAWGRVWEIHPLLVGVEHHRRGHGRVLVREIERLVAARGALTVTLGTADTTGETSLGGVDLYDRTYERLAEARTLAPHALGFWRGVGYTVVGVIPDAEGPGKPSITLARRL